MLITNQTTGTTASQSAQTSAPVDSSPSGTGPVEPVGGSGFEVLRGSSSGSLLEATSGTTPTTGNATSDIFGQIGEAWRKAAVDARATKEALDQMLKKMQ